MKPIHGVVEMETVACGNCGGTYALSIVYVAAKQEQGGFWNCPYCNTGWGYADSENDKLKKQIQNIENKLRDHVKSMKKKR